MCIRDSYKSFWDDGSIRTQGAYHKGKMQGSWLECEPGKGKSSCGRYSDDRKEGVWTHMDTTGLMEYVYSWEDGSRQGKYYAVSYTHLDVYKRQGYRHPV